MTAGLTLVFLVLLQQSLRKILERHVGIMALDDSHVLYALGSHRDGIWIALVEWMSTFSFLGLG